jgi:hypothetical protein
MKITLDHNCIIDLVNRTEIGSKIESILANSLTQCFVVNIGASEMRELGVKPETYELFEELLIKAGIENLPRLNPMGIFDITFFNKCVWAGDEDILLVQSIESALFGNSPKIDIVKEGIDSTSGKKLLNRICDVQGMWCHIQNKNDIFLTTDRNFKKQTKLPNLIALGAGKISHPNEL